MRTKWHMPNMRVSAVWRWQRRHPLARERTGPVLPDMPAFMIGVQVNRAGLNLTGRGAIARRLNAMIGTVANHMG